MVTSTVLVVECMHSQVLSLLCHCSVTALSLFNGHFTASQSVQRGLSSSESCQSEVSQLGGALTHHIQQLSSGLLEERGGEEREGKGRGRGKGAVKGSIASNSCVYIRTYVYM